jgi:superfamily I DNA and/or RNA helicase
MPQNIGVITPYEGQRAYITTYMQKHGPMQTTLYKDIEVASVDSFQGRKTFLGDIYIYIYIYITLCQALVIT